MSTVLAKKPSQAIVELRKSVESLNAASTDRVGSPSNGDVVRQGDLYLVNIENLPKGTKTKNLQLAPGETQGSRHIVTGSVEIVNEVKMDSLRTASPKVFGKKNIEEVLLGPAFSCKSDVEVTHPEHGNRILPSGTVWQVVYQQAYAETVRRAKD